MFRALREGTARASLLFGSLLIAGLNSIAAALLLSFALYWFSNWPLNILSIPLIVFGSLWILASLGFFVLGILYALWPRRVTDDYRSSLPSAGDHATGGDADRPRRTRWLIGFAQGIAICVLALSGLAAAARLGWLF